METVGTRSPALALLATAVALLVGVGHAEAAASAPVQLTGRGASAEWRGSVSNSAGGDLLAAAGAGATACDATTGADACDRVALDVRPRNDGDRLVVAIDYRETVNGFDVTYDASLHVYDPAGALVGSSLSPFTGQVVTVDDVRDGTYLVVVAADVVIGELPYRGYAALTKRPKSPAHRELLPNLVPQPPTSLQVASAPYSAAPPFIWDFRNAAKGPTSCYAQETVERGAQRCLRFDQTIANLGSGPLELHATEFADGAVMRQRIFHSDGTWRDRDAGEARFHLQHGHFHYQDYAQAYLYESDLSGARGRRLRIGFKQGFCMADVDNMRFGRPDQVQPRYLGPGLCDGQEETTTSRVGISVGWADTYPWYMGDQYLDISGVPDGVYLLEVTVNRTGALHETTLADNAAATLLRLSGDRVETLRHIPAEEWSS